MNEDETQGATSSRTELAEISRLLRLTLILATTGVVLWVAGDILLLIFSGFLFGVLLNALARLCSCATGIPKAYAVVLVAVVLVAALLGGTYFLLPAVAEQSGQLISSLSDSFQNLSRYAAKYFPHLHISAKEVLGAANLPRQLFGFTSTATGALLALVVVAFVGFYSALESGLYRTVLLRLFPEIHRAEAPDILRQVRETLEWWLLGRALTMSAVAVLTLAGLLLLGVPLAVPLSILAGLLTFIPYIGAIVSAVPAVLVAYAQGPLVAIYVVLVFAGAHAVEAYVVAPLVQRRVIRLPPVAMIASQAVMGALFGVAGLTLAAPLTAIAITLLRSLNPRRAGLRG